MGHARFALFYVLCGLGAAAAQILADPASGIPMVGASGAIGGVGSIGAQGGGVAFWAHVGGFVAGAALVLLFRDPDLVRRHPHRGWQQSG